MSLYKDTKKVSKIKKKNKNIWAAITTARNIKILKYRATPDVQYQGLLLLNYSL